MKIVETDNYGSDYPNEKFVNLPRMSVDDAHLVCKAINKACFKSDEAPRHWIVVPDDYKLKPGLEP